MRAGKAENGAREAEHHGDVDLAKLHRRRGSGSFIVMILMAIAISSFMAYRSFASAGQVGLTTALVLVVASILFGVFMPWITYRYEVENGTRVVRSLDPLAASLEEGAIKQSDALAEADSALAFVAGALQAMPGMFEAICDAVQETVNRSRDVASFAAYQAFNDDYRNPDPPQHRVVGPDGAIQLVPVITCGLPEAAGVETKPLISRIERIAIIQKRWDDLVDRRRLVRVHPWTTKIERA
jgi:hypothetical protein